MNKLLIEVPSHIKNDKELTEWICENADIFSEAMDLDVSQFDDRATVDEISITAVDIDTTTVVIHYEYEFSAYYGCRDMNYADSSDEAEIVGTRQGSTLSFEKFKPQERRSTYEEF